MRIKKQPNLPLEKLLSLEFCRRLFIKRRRLLAPDLNKIDDLVLKAIKFYATNAWQHAVVHYDIAYRHGLERRELDIYAGAHSSGLRRRTYEFLVYLWRQGFNAGEFLTPKPLFYHQPLQAMFYLEISGPNLLGLIEQSAPLKSSLILAGLGLAKIHKLPRPKNPKLNVYHFNARSLDPTDIITLTKTWQPRLAKTFTDWQSKLIRGHAKLPPAPPVVSHGDFHPENVIAINNETIGLIDFSESCLADPAYDAGSFLQQLRFMTNGRYPDATVSLWQKLFLKNYLDGLGIKKLSLGWRQRLFWHQAWTALRSAIFYAKLRDQNRINCLLKDVNFAWKQCQKK